MTITRIGQDHWIARGERIRWARERMRLNQDELADALEEILGRTYSRTVISNIEAGARAVSVDELRTLAHLLDQSEAWLDAEPEAAFNDAPKILGKHQFRLPGLPTYRPLTVAA